MFAPHWWHFVAVAPTSVPQAGHSFGLGFSFSLRKNPSNCFFHWSSFQRTRGESSKSVPCDKLFAFL
jgi:hypothetical protein